MKNHLAIQPDFIPIDPSVISLFDLCRSHAYIAYTISQELISDLYDIKNPAMFQEIMLNLWFDQIYNHSHFSSDLWNWGLQAWRLHGFIPLCTLEEAAYGALS